MGLILRSFKDGFKRARRNAKDRNGKRYTQESFAEAFGVSVDTVKNWEQGRTAPSIDILIELCDFFECDMDYLFGTLDCKTHDMQFIHNKTGLSEEAINELMYIKTLNDIVVEDTDLPTINALIEQLGEPKSVIRWITAYLCSNGLSKDYWYDTSTGRLSTNQILSKEPVIFIKSHSDTFDNAILLNIQECIKNLKNALRSEKESTQNTKKTPDTN